MTTIGKKNQILYAAREIVSEKGYFNMSLLDVANKVGISRRTIHRYFESKDELCFELAMIVLNDTLVSFEQKKQNNFESGYEELEYVLDNLIYQTIARRKELLFLYDFDRYVAPKFGDRYSEMYVDADILYSVIKRGVEDGSIKLRFETPEIMSYMLVETFYSLVLRYSILKDNNYSKRFTSASVMNLKKFILDSIKN